MAKSRHSLSALGAQNTINFVPAYAFNRSMDSSRFFNVLGNNDISISSRALIESSSCIASTLLFDRTCSIMALFTKFEATSCALVVPICAAKTVIVEKSLSVFAASLNSITSPKTTSAQNAKPILSSNESNFSERCLKQILAISSTPSPATPIRTNTSPGCLLESSQAYSNNEEIQRIDKQVDDAAPHILFWAIAVLATIKTIKIFIKK